jgi:two-component system CheB/CheR fusion protein
MQQRNNFQLLFLTMAAATMIVSAVSIFSLYTAAIDQHRLRLVEIVKSQARLIEAVAQFDSINNAGEQPEDARAATLKQVAHAHSQFEGIGESGEFAMARREHNQIVFVLSRKHLKTETPRPIPFNGEWAEPMRRALSGLSGVFTGLDYRGVQVLAAHEPISILDLGLVAKIDTSEIRAPFIRAGLIAIGVAMLVIFLASRLFYRIARPIEEAIEQQAETFKTLVDTAREGIILADIDGKIEFVNPAAEQIFGYHQDELLGVPLTRLMSDQYGVVHDGYIESYLRTGIGKIIGSGRQLIAIRKDGSRFPIHLSIGDIKLSHTRLFAGVIMDISEQQQLQRKILEIPVEEQRRIGQELHDGLGQQLTGLGMLATSLLNKASKPEHELASKLADGLQQAIAQIRAISRGLMPVDMDAAGFMNSLENLVDEIRAQTSISIQFSIDEKVHLSDNTSAMHLYRIAQETINNAIKHSNASQIRVTLGVEKSRGRLSISDNGSGMQDSVGDNKGLGLRIMEHRCGLIDAELIFKSSKSQGTEVKCLFPIETSVNPEQ